MPKAARPKGGVSPSLADYEVWGSVVSSPSGVWGGAPAENGFWCILSFKKPTSDSTQITAGGPKVPIEDPVPLDSP